jgi:anti-sigma B factor antagonist
MSMSPQPSSNKLHITRLPGPDGPILRCVGELTAGTAPSLRQELDRLIPLDHPGVIVNVAACPFLDVDGLLAILLAYKELRERGRTLVVVAGTESVARLFRVLGIDWVLPVFPSEEVATLALRGGGPAPAAPQSWAEAKERSLERWRAILAAIDGSSPEETGRQLTAMNALCERAEAIFESRPGEAEVRCRFCPFFHTLGGRPEDVGCRSLLDPMLESLLRGEKDSAREQVAAMIRALEAMPV